MRRFSLPKELKPDHKGDGFNLKQPDVTWLLVAERQQIQEIKMTKLISGTQFIMEGIKYSKFFRGHRNGNEETPRISPDANKNDLG